MWLRHVSSCQTKIWTSSCTFKDVTCRKVRKDRIEFIQHALDFCCRNENLKTLLPQWSRGTGFECEEEAFLRHAKFRVHGIHFHPHLCFTYDRQTTDYPMDELHYAYFRMLGPKSATGGNCTPMWRCKMAYFMPAKILSRGAPRPGKKHVR